MTDVAFAHYIRFLDKSGAYIPNRNYQNFFVAEQRTFSGVGYVFAPFGLTGMTSTRGGDNPTTNLVSIPNDLSVSLVAEAALASWLVEVRTVNITVTEAGSMTEGAVLISDIWSCSSGNQDSEKIVLILSSPLDATQAQVPKRVLSSYLVGSVPPTGAISAN